MRVFSRKKNTENTENTIGTNSMICPKCHTDVPMLKFTTDGTHVPGVSRRR